MKVAEAYKKLCRWAMAIVEVKRFPDKEVFAEAEAILKEFGITNGKLDGYCDDYHAGLAKSLRDCLIFRMSVYEQ
jgi:hypothetical protein